MLDGVIEALNPVTLVILSDVVEKVSVFVVETTWRILPDWLSIGRPELFVIVPVKLPVVALTVPTVIFGVPLNPVALPDKLAVIVPALKFPEELRATMVEAVLALVALLVTVNVDAPEPL